jgi:hypothetical protein
MFHSESTNASSKPQFEGQAVKYFSPHCSEIILVDVARKNRTYGHLEWWAMTPLDVGYEHALHKAQWAE